MTCIIERWKHLKQVLTISGAKIFPCVYVQTNCLTFSHKPENNNFSWILWCRMEKLTGRFEDVKRNCSIGMLQINQSHFLKFDSEVIE